MKQLIEQIIKMIKTLHSISIVLIISLLLIIVSEKFYPIAGMELIYAKKFYLAIAYLLTRLTRNYLMRKEQKIS